MYVWKSMEKQSGPESLPATSQVSAPAVEGHPLSGVQLYVCVWLCMCWWVSGWICTCVFVPVHVRVRVSL